VSAKKAVEDYVATLQYVNSIIHNHHHDNNNNKSIIDARPADRFNGIVAEPRANLRKGHIPYSINIPFMTVLEPNDVTSFNMDMLLNNNKNMISSLLMGEGKEELIFTCGSGVSAAVLLMAN
ncbi:thiosulfate sulfertansferase, putative, partial [Perkinsus marinus ATCC 50983]